MKPFLPILVLLSIPSGLLAQKGKFIDVYGFGQQTNIANYFDIGYGPRSGLGRTFTTDPSYSYGGAVYFNYLVGEYTGWKTGLIYSRYLQNMSSGIQSAPSPERDSITFNTELVLNQISVPAIVDFSISSSEDTRVYFNLGLGLQLNYLMSGSFNLETTPEYPVNSTFDLSDYYDRINLSYLVNIELRIRIGSSDKTYFLMGINYDKSIGGIEKEGKDFDAQTPKELTYPLGTLKDYDYDVSASRKTYNTKLDAVALRVGLSFRLSD